MKREMLSPKYTARFSDLLRVKSSLDIFLTDGVRV